MKVLNTTTNELIDLSLIDPKSGVDWASSYGCPSEMDEKEIAWWEGFLEKKQDWKALELNRNQTQG